MSRQKTKPSLARHALFFSLIFTPLFSNAVESVNVQTFNPSTSDEFVLLEDGFRPTWPKNSRMWFGANYNWMNDPLVATDDQLTGRIETLIDSVQTLDAFIGFKAAPRLALFAGAPIHLVSYPTGSTQAALGDMRVLAKVRLTSDDSATAVAFIPEIRLPTGDAVNFVSDASVVLSGKLAVEHEFKNLTLAANLGFISAPNSKYFNIDYTKRLFIGLGALFPITDQWGLNLEYAAQMTLPVNPYLYPNEIYGGARYLASENLVCTGGISLGSITGPTGQDVRVIAGVRYTWYDPYEEPRPAPTPLPPPVQEKPAPVAIFTPKKIEVLKPILFEHDSADLIPESKLVLNEVADVMKRNNKKFSKILVDGHTNVIGEDKYNLQLSLDRAKSVKAYLITQGISEKKLDARGFGERKPKVPPTDLDAEDINRRVEFIVVK